MTTRPATETDLTRFYELFPQPGLARDLFNIVEGHRVDAAIRRAYPGIRRDMALIQAASAERRPELAALSDSQAVVEPLGQLREVEPQVLDLYLGHLAAHAQPAQTERRHAARSDHQPPGAVLRARGPWRAPRRATRRAPRRSGS